MKHLSELLTSKVAPKNSSERSELMKYWCDGVLNKQGKKYPPAFICSKMSCYSIKDLRYMESVCRDYVHRGGNISKYWWSLFKV